MQTIAYDSGKGLKPLGYAPFLLSAIFLGVLLGFTHIFAPLNPWIQFFGIGITAVLCVFACYKLTADASSKHNDDLIGILEKLNSEVHILTNQIRTMEEELVQSKESLVITEKMASLGQLSAGVAHEINNPVGFMMSNMCTLKEYVFFLDQLSKQSLELLAALSKQEKLNHEEIIEKIQNTLKIEDLDFVLSDANALIDESLNGGTRIKEITNSMKGYVSESQEVQEVLVTDLIEQTLSIAWNQIKYNCTVEKQFGSHSPVRLIPSSFNQVLLNIMVNASHAMEGLEGKLSISTYEKDNSVFIEITDTGCGIEEQNLSKIFEPFFTTKPVGQGTGLGMSISYEIVTAAGGTIEARSEVGEGTTFTIRLPIAKELAA